ncbi:MAG: aminopeptidase N C-terminal domain-containing protein, partial [Burkholderiales bacterium]
LAHLMAHDSDAFNRWEAGQRLATGLLLGGTKAAPRSFIDAWARVLKDAAQDPAFASEALGLPSETTLAEQMDVVDPDALHAARNGLRRQLAGALREELLATYGSMTIDGPYSPDAASAGKRSLKNLCLGVLMELDDTEIRALCVKQFETADNMTDAMAALTLLANTDCAERAPALESFHARWKDEPLVVDKWLAVQATARLPGTLAEVKRLTAHPAFDSKNPNKIYALIRAFVAANHVRFHAADGGGYAFAADQVIAIDTLNPQVAARVARCFDRWKKFDAGRQAHAKAALERVLGTDGLSRDVAEIVGKALA